MLSGSGGAQQRRATHGSVNQFAAALPPGLFTRRDQAGGYRFGTTSLVPPLRLRHEWAALGCRRAGAGAEPPAGPPRLAVRGRVPAMLRRLCHERRR